MQQNFWKILKVFVNLCECLGIITAEKDLFPQVFRWVRPFHCFHTEINFAIFFSQSSIQGICQRTTRPVAKSSYRIRMLTESRFIWFSLANHCLVGTKLVIDHLPYHFIILHFLKFSNVWVLSMSKRLTWLLFVLLEFWEKKTNTTIFVFFQKVSVDAGADAQDLWSNEDSKFLFQKRTKRILKMRISSTMVYVTARRTTSLNNKTTTSQGAVSTRHWHKKAVDDRRLEYKSKTDFKVKSQISHGKPCDRHVSKHARNRGVSYWPHGWTSSRVSSFAASFSSRRLLSGGKLIQLHLSLSFFFFQGISGCSKTSGWIQSTKYLYTHVLPSRGGKTESIQ